MRRQRQQNHPPLSIYCVSPNNADTFYSGKTQQQHTCSQYCGNWSVYDVVGYMEALPWHRQVKATNHHIGGTMVQWQQTLLSLIGFSLHFSTKNPYSSVPLSSVFEKQHSTQNVKCAYSAKIVVQTSVLVLVG